MAFGMGLSIDLIFILKPACMIFRPNGGGKARWCLRCVFLWRVDSNKKLKDALVEFCGEDGFYGHQDEVSYLSLWL